MNEETIIDVQKVKYPVVKEAFERIGAKQVKNDPNAQIYWFDGTIPLEEFGYLFPHQRINKIPGMDYLCYKSSFFQALNNMRNLYPSFYTFYPPTFLLPYQFTDFQREHVRSCNKIGNTSTWIWKPRSGCCGNGIKLVQNPFDLADSQTPAIVQRYVSPYLINGFKFDFRFYVLIASLQPFSVFIYNEGIARFCTQKYKPPNRNNLDDKFSHLTNTAVNVENKEACNDFTQLASTVLEKIAKGDSRGRNVWTEIQKVVQLSLVAEYSQIVQQITNFEIEKRNPQTYGKKFKNLFVMREKPSKAQCSLDIMSRYFHILGIDIILNDLLQPIVLELNDRPSMCVTFDLEGQLKPQMLYDAMQIITPDGSIPAKYPQSWQKLLPVGQGKPMATVIQMMINKSMEELAPRLSIRKTLVRSSIRSKKSSLPPLKSSMQ